MFVSDISLKCIDREGLGRSQTRTKHCRPESHLGVWARGTVGSGDIRFEVLDFRTSGHFRFKSKLEDFESPKLTVIEIWLEQVNAIRNVVDNQKWREVLKSRTSNPVSPEPPCPYAQAPQEALGTRMGLGMNERRNSRHAENVSLSRSG